MVPRDRASLLHTHCFHTAAPATNRWGCHQLALSYLGLISISKQKKLVNKKIILQISNIFIIISYGK